MNTMPTQTIAANKKWILLVLCLGVVLIQVDTSLVNLAAPLIGKHLHVSLATLQWTVDGYNLSYAVLLMTGGTLADVLGRRRIFLTGITLFVLGSGVCALASRPIALIGGRVTSGVGAAMLVPASLAILRVVWAEPHERAQAIGVFASMNGLAFALGPPLGGLLAWFAGWRSIFWIAVLTGIAVLWLAAGKIPESRDLGARKLDLPGQVFAAAILAALVIAVIERGDVAVMCALVGIPALLAFAWCEYRAGDTAMIPLRLLRNRQLATAIVIAAAMTFGMYGAVFLLPMTWLQTGVPNVFEAGILMVPMALSFAILSRWSGVWTRRFGPRWMMTTGMALIGLGLLILSASHAGHPLWLAEIGLLATGIGMALNTGPVLNLAISTVTHSRAGTASGLVNSGRMVGATLGVAALGGLYSMHVDIFHGFTWAMTAGGAIAWLGACLAFALVRRPTPTTDSSFKRDPSPTKSIAGELH